MLVEIGHFALVLALLVAAVQGTVPLVGASVRSRPLMDLAQPAALVPNSRTAVVSCLTCCCVKPLKRKRAPSR